MLFFTERKASKELQASGLTVRAAGSGSMAAMKDGIHAREARVIRQPPPFSLTSRREALTRRAPCACGRGLPSRTEPLHGEWWPVRALRALQHLSSRGYALSSRSMRVRDGSLGESFGAFLLSEKSTYLSPLIKEKRVLFFAERIKAVFIAIFCYLCYYEQNHYQ